MPYWFYLIVISVLFVALERLWPWRQQALWRPGLASDVLFLAFNGYLLGLLLSRPGTMLAEQVDRWLLPLTGAGYVAPWPIWAQVPIAFFGLDFLEWNIHRLLHRAPWLWSFHKVHHSISTMDWIGNMRFHWLEIVVYRSLKYLPLRLLGFDWQVLFWLGVFSTFMGHFNHSNLYIHLGPLRYLFNQPAMHIWHHEDRVRFKYGCNFGINLSLWDWLFKTAYMPMEPRQPDRLGFAGLDAFPKNFPAMQALPVRFK